MQHAAPGPTAPAALGRQAGGHARRGLCGARVAAAAAPDSCVTRVTSVALRCLVDSHMRWTSRLGTLGAWGQWGKGGAGELLTPWEHTSAALPPTSCLCRL